jgi:receptor protein-tyrosine kinase
MVGNRMDMIERAAARLRNDPSGPAKPVIDPPRQAVNGPGPSTPPPPSINNLRTPPPQAAPPAVPSAPIPPTPGLAAPASTPKGLSSFSGALKGLNPPPISAAPPEIPVAPPPKDPSLSGEAGPTGAKHSRTVVLDTARLALAGTVDWTADRTPVMEELRLIKRRLLRRAFDNREAGNSLSHLVMVTSAKPREGKTFAATNIAISISLEEDYNVLLVDADIRRQALRQNLGLEANQGFVDLLLNPSLDMADVLLRTNIPRLSVLPAGTMSDRAPELLASGRMRDLIDDMARRYDDRIILFDTAPCLVSSDAATLAAHVGQVVFVVEAEQTQQHEIIAALNLISACPEISFILNKAQPLATTSYGGYGAY